MEYNDFPAMNDDDSWLSPEERNALLQDCTFPVTPRINAEYTPKPGEAVFIHTDDDLLPFISDQDLFMAILIGIISACGYVLATA